MKLRLIFCSCCLAAICSVADAQPDSVRLFSELDEYLSAMDKLSVADAEKEADLAISSVQDSLLREKVAAHIYRHFRESKMMSSDNVAVWIYDNWYASYRVLFDDIDDFEEARFHAFVNRGSLLGKKAPPLTLPLLSPTARKDSVALPAKRRPAIIFFYSTGCPNCLVTSLKLRSLLDKGHYRINVYTVYTGDDLQQAEAYLAKELKIRNTCRTKVYNLYGGDVDYVVPYGVVRTPRLFLVDSEGIVIGRGLDGDALDFLLRRM